MSAFQGKPISEIIEDNTVEFFLNLGRVNGSEVCDCPEIKFVFDSFGYNRIIRARFRASEADAIVGRIVSRVDALGAEALWFVAPADTIGLSSILNHYGFIYKSEWMSMAIDLTTFSPSSKCPEGLEICKAENNEDLDAWANVVISSYGLDSEIHGEFGRYLIARGNADSFRRDHFLGLLDGKPVATTILFKGQEDAGIYWVGTLPEARKRGIANSMVLHTLFEAKNCGYKIAILNASAKGHPLYQQIGFNDYYTTSIYCRKNHTKKGDNSKRTKFV